MFCEEAIVKVYQRVPDCEKATSRRMAYLQIAYQMEYHTTEGYWLVFLTKNHVITVGADGVKLFDSLEAAVPDLDSLISDDIIPPNEFALFLGERLCALHPQENYLELRFDHFSMKLYVYNDAEKIWFAKERTTGSYAPLAAGRHLLTARCVCGGEGELIVDFVDDVLVRCRKCHRSTWAEMYLMDAVEAWNDGETPLFFHAGEEELQAQLDMEAVRCLDVSDAGFCLEGETKCRAERVMVVFSGCAYQISSVRTCEGTYDFAMFRVNEYSTKAYTRRIASWENRGIFSKGIKTDASGRFLCFEIDGGTLRLTPGKGTLTVELSFPDSCGSARGKKQRRALFQNRA